MIITIDLKTIKHQNYLFNEIARIQGSDIINITYDELSALWMAVDKPYFRKWLVNFGLIPNALSNSVKYENLSLIGIEIINAIVSYCNFYDCNLELGIFNGIHGNELNFVNCKLTESKFNRAILTNAKFNNCKCEFVDFSNADLTHASFSNCDLIGSKFCFSNLDFVEFKNCNIQNVDFMYSSTTSSFDLPDGWLINKDFILVKK